LYHRIEVVVSHEAARSKRETPDVQNINLDDDGPQSCFQATATHSEHVLIDVELSHPRIDAGGKVSDDVERLRETNGLAFRVPMIDTTLVAKSAVARCCVQS